MQMRNKNMVNTLKVLSLLFVFSFMVSCGSKKKIASAASAVDAEAASVIAKHVQQELDFESIRGRMKVHFQTAHVDQAATVSFRMKKDEVIWLSAELLGIPLAKVMITPESVQYYEKIGNTYFEGDFRLLSKLLGTPMDFDKVQNLFLGQTIYNLQNEPYELTASNKGYQLESKEWDLVKKLFLLDAATYKTLAQQLSQTNANRNVTVTYPQYQEVGSKIFPKEIKIIANDGGSTTQIEMGFKSIQFDMPLSFPFSIPSGYEKISVE